MEYYFLRYGDLELHRRMIADRVRTEAFARAIAEEITAADVVLDVGTGTGILAMLSARAGARRVYGNDQAEIAQAAANLVKANGLAERVKILRGPAAELQLEEPATVIVSEWLGNFAFVESMLDDVIAARDHNLVPGGRMLPSSVAVMLAPVDDSALYHTEGPGYWRRELAGLDLSPLESLEQAQGRALQIRVDPGTLLCAGQPIIEIQVANASVDSPYQEGKVAFRVERDGVLNGFCGWFVARLSRTVSLDTGPHQPETHWAQTYLPFPPRVVRKGRSVEVHYRIQRDPEERRYLRLILQVGRVRQDYRLE